MLRFNVFKGAILSATLVLVACDGEGVSSQDTTSYSSTDTTSYSSAGSSSSSSQVFALSGAITGLDGKVIVSDGRGFSKEFTSGGVFNFFPLAYEAGQAYDIGIIQHPDGQLCSVKSGSGTFSAEDITNVEISCIQQSAPLALIGLASNLSEPVQLREGNDVVINVLESGIVHFENTYHQGDAYLVSLQDAGDRQRCTLKNAIGVFGDEDIFNVLLSCEYYLPTHEVSVSVSGLVGEIVLESNIAPFVYSHFSEGGDGSIYIGAVSADTQLSLSVANVNDAYECETANFDILINEESLLPTVTCSKKPVSYSIAGRVSGIYSSLTLMNSAGNDITLESNGPFNLGEYLENTEYELSFKDVPDGHVCEIDGAKGTLVADVTDVSVHCQLEGLVLGGLASGISSDVVLADGQGNSVTVTSNGEFSFYPTLYDEEGEVSVGVVEQPPGQVCEVFYGAGTLADAGKHDVQLVCRHQSAQLSACSAAAVVENEAKFTLTRSVAKFNEMLGEGGFSLFDANQNGFPEILFGEGQGFGKPTRFFVIEYDEVTGGYKTLCGSTPFADSISRVVSFKNRTLNAASLIGLESGEIVIFNHTAGSRFTTIDAGMEITDLIVGDADNDGTEEIIVLSEQMLKLYDVDTFELEQMHFLGGQEMALGYLTQDMTLELAINTGVVLSLVKDNFAINWDYRNSGFGDRFLDVGDVDNDGLDEVVAGDRWHAIRVFNADTKGTLWDVDPGLDIDVLVAEDTDGDGIAEVIYADGQHGATYVLNGSDGEEITSFSNPASGVTDIAVADFDGDNSLEMIRGTGSGSTADDVLVITEFGSRLTEWQAPEASGGSSINTFTSFDITGDNIADFIFAPSGDGTYVEAIDGQSGETLWRTPAFDRAWEGLNGLAAGDIDGNGSVDVILGSSVIYDGSLHQINASDGVVSETVLVLDDGTTIGDVLIADIDNDQTLEVIAGSRVVHTGASGATIYVVDGESFVLESRSPRISSGFTSIRTMEVVDFDGDGNLDIAALAGNVHIYNPKLNSMNVTVGQFLSIATNDSDLYAANSNGEIYSINSVGSETLIAHPCNDDIVAMEAISNIELAVVCEERLGIYNLEKKQFAWQTGAISDSMGRFDSMEFNVVDGVETLYVGGRNLMVFERRYD